MKKYILGAVLSLGILALPAFTQAAALTDAQAATIITVVKSSPSTPASAFINLITAFSGVTDSQAASLIVVVQSSPNTAASVFVPLLTSFTSGTAANQTTTQSTTSTTQQPAQTTTSAAQPSITILSPNGGGTWYRGDNAVVTWTTTNIPQNNQMLIRVRNVSTNQEYNLRTDTNNDGSEEVPVLYGIPIGRYTLEIKTIVNNQSYLDASNSSFTVTDLTTTAVLTAAPAVSTVSASATSNSITLNGTANPNGLATTGWFRAYGSYYNVAGTNERCSNSFGVRSLVPDASLGSGSSWVPYSYTVTGLVPSTLYYYCAAASNSQGTAYGYIQSVTTTASATAVPTPAPVATTPATTITYSYPTLSLTANGSPVYDGGTFQATSGTVSLVWGSTSATSCTINGLPVSTSGSQTLSGMTTSSHTYACVNAVGSSVMSTSLRFTVLAVPAPVTPTIQLYQVGNTLEWHASPDTAPTTCVSRVNGTAGQWANLTTLNGSMSLTGIPSGTYVEAYCTRDGVTGPTPPARFCYGSCTYTLNSTNSNTNQMASALGAFSSATGANSFSYAWNNDLQIGSPYFADVSALQTALARENVYAGEVTGGFYNQTFVAVKAFQQKYGIEATGFVGPATRAKLNALY